MNRKGLGLGPSNLSGLDENLDYTCPDQAELPVFGLTGHNHIQRVMTE